MRPRLQPFGTDFGNGEVDRRYFQRDNLEAQYLSAKQATRGRYRVVTESPREDAAHAAVLRWIRTCLAEERPDLSLHGHAVGLRLEVEHHPGACSSPSTHSESSGS